MPTYFCVYKIHTYQGRLDATPSVGAGRFALYTLKALAFIRLKRDERAESVRILAALRRLDPLGGTGWQVVAALLDAA